MQAQPAAVYDHRARSLGRIQAKREKLTERLANARLAVFILGLLAALYLHRFSTPLVGLSTGILTLLLYAFLVFRHRKLLEHLRYVITLRGINERGAARTAGRWTEFSDTGSDFRDDDHPYASDLDLFGRGSLFRWINSTSTPLGREGLARLLKEPLAERTEILARQEAVTELARKLAWRQRFEAEGLLVPRRDQTTEPLLQWAGRSSQAYLHPAIHLGIRALPAVTIFSLALWAFLPALSWQLPAILVVIQALLLLVGGKARALELAAVYQHEASLRTYARLLKVFENQKFEAAWLRERQERMRDASGRPAFQQVARLSKIVERIGNRQNALFIPLNILLLWGYHCMATLAHWKRESGRRLKAWLETLAEVEALSSLANVRFEHPDWTLPSLVEERANPSVCRHRAWVIR